MSLRLRVAATVAVLLAPLWAFTAAASYRTVADDALARSSAAAVRGRVVTVTPSWDAAVDAIYTYVTLDVARSWGLEGAPAQIVVKVLGGAVADTALVIGGQAHFDIGEDVLVFLDVRPRDGTLSVAGLEQGKWAVTGFDAPAAAFERDVRGNDPAVVVAREYRSAADLDALAALAGTRVSAAGAVLHPDPAASAPADAPGHGVAAFTLLSTTPARWHQADSGTPVYVDTQTGGHPQIASGGLPQLANAAAMWTAAGSLRLAPGVQRSARCFSNSENDSRISVTYGDPCGEIADASSTLAIGGAYFSGADIRTINGVAYWKITKGMVVTDNATSKFSGMSLGCYEEMLTHELGHSIGFGHAAARPAVMYPAISSGCGSRTTSLPLQADDLAGMTAVYPGSAPTLTPPGPPSGLTASVSGSTVSFTWTAPSSGPAPTGYRLYAGSAPGAANYGGIAAVGVPLVIPNVPNGTYYVRLVAVNAAGASAPTADLMVTVGPVVPGMPRNVSASAGAGGTVLVTWQPPATGGTPASYVLVAGLTPGAPTYQIPVAGTAFSAAGVPAGVYYVRIVALNSAGIGPLTPEVALTVPR